jgi:hypothetical protein
MPTTTRKQPRPRELGKRVQLSLRVTPSLKNQLDAAAAVSGRSQSQEVEFRLERSFARELEQRAAELEATATPVQGRPVMTYPQQQVQQQSADMTDNEGLRTPKYWRDRAEEARTKADEMRDAATRDVMLGVAKSYERMVKLASRRADDLSADSPQD